MYYRCMWSELIVSDCSVREEVIHDRTEWKERQGLYRSSLCKKGKRSQTVLALERADELERRRKEEGKTAVMNQKVMLR